MFYILTKGYTVLGNQGTYEDWRSSTTLSARMSLCLSLCLSESQGIFWSRDLLILNQSKCYGFFLRVYDFKPSREKLEEKIDSSMKI